MERGMEKEMSKGIESQASPTLPPDSTLLAEKDAETMDPYKLFSICLEEAMAAGHIEPSGMAVCGIEQPKAGAEGGEGVEGSADPIPSCRVVLCRGFDAEGLLFYTNGESAKARAFKSCSQVAATFWWERLGRQVRWTGTIEPATTEESDAYWNRRHPGHKRGAWASKQSQPIGSRSELEKSMEEVIKRFPDDNDIPRPPHWHGWRIRPRAVEFWQQRTNRLHDRILFTRDPTTKQWSSKRLQP